MNKLNKNKKAVGIVMIVGIIILLVIFGLLIFIIFPNLLGSNSIITALTKHYTAPDIKQENAYGFVADTIDVVNDPSLAKCTKTSNYVYACPSSTRLDFKVVVKNTGSVIRSIYARPRVGFKCNNKAECSSESWMRSTQVCAPLPGITADCFTTEPYIFDKKGEYRIYPGAECIADDCPPTDFSLSSTYSLNKNSWITVVIS